MQNQSGLKSAVLWIGILLVLLIVLNIAAFNIYQETIPLGDFWGQLWNYFDSVIFKVITVSLILPLILFTLEQRFKIATTVRQKRAEELKDKRWECIEQTSRIWNQLWDLTSEVVYFKKGTDKEKIIEDLLIRLRNLTTSAEDVINMWSHRFPDLPDEYERAFLVFFNTELNSAETIAWCIRHSESAGETREIRKLQNSLKRIVESINYLTHHRCIDVLKNSTQLLELREVNAPKNEQKKTESLLNKRVAYLKAWADAIENKEIENNTPFSFANTKRAEVFRDSYLELRKWMLKHPKQNPATAKGYKKKYGSFGRLFYQIPHEQVGPWFSKKFVMYLANWVSLEYERISLMHQMERREESAE